MAKDFKVTNPDAATFDEKAASKWLGTKKDEQDKVRRKEPRIPKATKTPKNQKGDA